MNEDIISKICVRIILRIDGEDVSLGSGTLLKGKDGFYVVTAHHCVYGDKNAYPNIQLQQIVIQQQKSFNASFEDPIEIIEITESNFEDDWALIKVKIEDTCGIHPIISTSINFKRNDAILFTGFQLINGNESRTFSSKVQNGISGTEFRITLAEKDTFKGGGDHAKGLSGSGAFLVDPQRHILVGILKNVKGEVALNDDIKCCCMEKIAHLIGLEIYEVLNDPKIDDFGTRKFGEIVITDKRNLMEKIIAVNADFSARMMKRYRQQLALGKDELDVIPEREMSAIKYRLFIKCQEVLDDFVAENHGTVLTEKQIEGLIKDFTDNGIEIIDIKSKRYNYPIIDDDLMRKIILDLINECYLSFDKEGLYATE
ncbi:trypsin-like serine protease [Sphingobacterium siyangense]|uniref:trypsin-like serine protease n=1 Tax=Sphingobacterium siyangense TaxID=459529 RepID=UPI001964A7C3|nr:trypsin-like serine protease [Sphingobacterium siyangense]QRY55936.1 trypsin-like serine protease [Sphingobacterium siyangense]